MRKILSVLIICLLFVGCGYANLDDVKANAEKTWADNGFEIVGYQGWEWSMWFGGSYGGAFVWYTLHKIPDNGIIYDGALMKWGDEYHIYNLEAKDAIKP